MEGANQCESLPEKVAPPLETFSGLLNLFDVATAAIGMLSGSRE